MQVTAKFKSLKVQQTGNDSTYTVATIKRRNSAVPKSETIEKMVGANERCSATLSVTNRRGKRKLNSKIEVNTSDRFLQTS